MKKTKERMRNVNGNKKIQKEEKGITLIALVITILVLIILAGVTLNVLTGDNGIINRAIQSKNRTAEEQTKEEVNIALEALQIERNVMQMTQNEQREFLESEIRNIEPRSSVEIYQNGFIVKHKGFDFEISDKLAIVNTNETFNTEEWDKTAAPEDVFIWQSDDPKDEGYGIIIGYKAEIAEGYTVLRYPSRCKVIDFSHDLNYNGITTAMSRSFTNNISQIEIPGTVYEIKNLGHSSNNSFQNLSVIKLSNGIKTIDIGYITKMQSINIPNSVTTLELIGCTSLTNVNIPDNVTNLILSGCTSLTNVNIPEKITNLKNAFNGCTGLTSIKIPDAVTNLQGTFYNCTNLSSVTFRGVTYNSKTEIQNKLVEEGIEYIFHPTSNVSIGAFDNTGLSN